jgi:hypothetical protein
MIGQRAAEFTDYQELVANLRPADRAEIAALRGDVSALDIWMAGHFDATAVHVDGVLVCIYGVNQHPIQEYIGIPWLLGTVALDRNILSLCKMAPKILKQWHRKYETLTNFTDARNGVIRKWLAWLGFYFVGMAPVGPDRLPFIQFVRHASGAYSASPRKETSRV